MWISKRVLLAGLAASVGALSLALAVGAFGRDGRGGSGGGHRHGGTLLEQTLAPSQPSDPEFHRVTPGAAPWVLRRGDVELRSRGRLRLEVRGLVIPTAPANGTPGPVTTINASLYCGPDANTAPADTSRTVPISRRGNARIDDKSFAVPATCLAPVILVHPNGDLAHYIAVDGWRR